MRKKLLIIASDDYFEHKEIVWSELDSLMIHDSLLGGEIALVGVLELNTSLATAHSTQWAETNRIPTLEKSNSRKLRASVFTKAFKISEDELEDPIIHFVYFKRNSQDTQANAEEMYEFAFSQRSNPKFNFRTVNYPELKVLGNN